MSGFLLVLAAAAAGGALYRLRGGWLKTLAGIGSTQVCRAVWALPTAGLIWWLAGGPWWLALALVATVFASMALIGHGAHMIMDAELMAHGRFEKTELLTRWLPKVLGGEPDPAWLDDGDATDVIAYNVIGMSFIGVVRNALAITPLAAFAPVPAALYAATGLAHGPLYWLGWKITPDIRAAEVLVGAVSWAAIVILFGRF